MKRSFLIGLLFTVLASGVLGQRTMTLTAKVYAPPKPSEFKEFVAPDKSFKIVFAGEPESGFDDSAPRGSIFTYAVEKDAWKSDVTIFDFEFVVDDPEYVYRLMRGDPGSSRKLVAERETKIYGLAAREFEVEHLGDLELARIMIVDNRMYQLRSRVTNWQLLSKRYPAKAAEFRAETTRFFDSFTLLKMPEPDKKPLPDEFLGALIDDIYDNPYFGFRLKLPQGWTQIEQEIIDTSRKTGVELLKTDEESFDRKLEGSAEKEVIIFGASNRKPGQAEGGSVLLISVFRQPNGPITSRDVIDTSVKFLGSNPKLEFGEIESMTRSGVRIAYVDFTTTLGGIGIKQRMFVFMRKRYSITSVIAYTSESDFKVMKSMVDGIEFK